MTFNLRMYLLLYFMKFLGFRFEVSLQSFHQCAHRIKNMTSFSLMISKIKKCFTIE